MAGGLLQHPGEGRAGLRSRSAPRRLPRDHLREQVRPVPMDAVRNLFDLTGRVAVITGGAGMLGEQHAEAVASAGGIPVLVDVQAAQGERLAERVAAEFGVPASAVAADVADEAQVERLRE